MTHDERTALATAVADALGPGWCVETIDPTWPTRYLKCTDGVRIALGFRDGRIQVSGDWPRTSSGEACVPYFREGSKRPDITIAADRSPAAVAREIARRFLPAYLPLWTAEATRARTLDDAAATTRRVSAQLAEAFGIKRREPNRGAMFESLRIYHDGDRGFWGDIEVSGDRVTIKLHGLTVETTIALAALLRQQPAAG